MRMGRPLTRAHLRNRCRCSPPGAGRNKNVYTQVETPGSIDHLVNELQHKYDRPLPAAALLLTDAYEGLMAAVVDVKDLDRVATSYSSHQPVGPNRSPELTLRALGGWTTHQMNHPAAQEAEIPSSNGIGTAHAIARHYAALIGDVDGARILEPQTLAVACEVQSDGPDRVLGARTRCGLGFALAPSLGVPAGPRSFGHPGSGGSLGFADPAAGVALGYTPNRMGGVAIGDIRTASLVESLYRCL
jgi:CubicO group peptidase (beta-lactamase class C family)